MNYFMKNGKEIESLENISNQLKNHKDQTRYNEIQAQIKQLKGAMMIIKDITNNR